MTFDFPFGYDVWINDFCAKLPARTRLSSFATQKTMVKFNLLCLSSGNRVEFRLHAINMHSPSVCIPHTLLCNSIKQLFNHPDRQLWYKRNEKSFTLAFSHSQRILKADIESLSGQQLNFRDKVFGPSRRRSNSLRSILSIVESRPKETSKRFHLISSDFNCLHFVVNFMNFIAFDVNLLPTRIRSRCRSYIRRLYSKNLCMCTRLSAFPPPFDWHCLRTQLPVALDTHTWSHTHKPFGSNANWFLLKNDQLSLSWIGQGNWTTK